jgi:hypothetical protein
MIVSLLLALAAAPDASPRAIHFENDILPILSRHGCNSSGCHGKAEGQNGFKLSVFAFDPDADFRALVMEGRGRRFLPSAPRASLFLRKMSGEMPHGGGARIRAGTRDYATIRAWVAAGMPRGEKDAPHVVRVRVEPREGVLEMGASQKLRVVARYSDGREADVTSLARYSTNNEALASVDADGSVTAGKLPGSAAVMASFMNAYDVFRVLVPRRQKLERYPDVPTRNDIDKLVDARLKKLQIAPSGLCDDATFLRRAHLDLIGRLPTIEETRAFLASRSAKKREELIDALLKRPEFADYWAMKWADLLHVNRAALGPKRARAYHAWVRKQVAASVPLDRFARAIVTAEGPFDEVPPAIFYSATKKPGEQAASLAQVFLGVRIACAECHHHPFDRWGQDDYHALSAYFTGARTVKAGPLEALEVTGIAVATQPRTKQALFARPLGGKPPTKLDAGDRRSELADWMVSPDNPWFARNLANRVWAHLTGRGLVEPLDDVRDTNPPTNPELLDLLAKQLIREKYDLRKLIRFNTTSRTYQLSTMPTPSNADDAQNYSRGLLRRVPAEVLLDMVRDSTGVGERFRGAPPGTRAVQLWDSKVDHYFLKAFGRPERTGACECERNSEPAVAQVLHLMNAPEIEAKLSHAAGSVARLEKKHTADADLIEALYLTFFSRLPLPKEKAAGLAHLKAAKSRRQGAEDLAWALLNTVEFSFNH